MDDFVAVGLFRHGLTDANVNKQFCGWTNVPVNKAGMEALSGKSAPHYDWIVSSDLLRCRQTAAVLWKEPADLCPGFREFYFGEWEGKTHLQLERDFFYQQWLYNYQLPVPGGDSYAGFAGRVEKSFDFLLQTMSRKHIQRAAVVTHGGVIRHLMKTYAPETDLLDGWSPQNGSGFELSGSLAEMRRRKPCTLLQAVPLMEKNNG